MIDVGKHPATFGDLLSVLFIALKLTGEIEWSWLWVLSPLWVSLVVVLVVDRWHERQK